MTQIVVGAGGQLSDDALGDAARNLSAVLTAGAHAGRHAMHDVGVEVTNEVRRLVSQPGTGRVYSRRGVAHRASSPGEPPAVDTGRLRSSYGWRVAGGLGGWFVEVGTNVRYAPMLEFGTSRMAARPHLRPAIERTTVRIGGIIAARIAREQAQAARQVRTLGGQFLPSTRLPRLM
jgi:hypothetical protein